MRWKRYSFVFVSIAVLAAVTLFSLSFVHERPTYASDSVVYMKGAQSLAEGDGYTVNGRPQTSWPPGYSCALVMPLLICGSSVTAFKVMNVLFALGALVFQLMFLKELKGRSHGLLLVTALAVFFPWIYYTHFIGSDLLFTLLLSVFLWGGIRYRQDGSLAGFLFMTIALMFAPLVRMAGVSLFPAWIAGVFWTSPTDNRTSCGTENSKRVLGLKLGLLIVAAVPLCLWFLRNYLLLGNVSSISTGVTPEYMSSLSKIGITQFNLLTKVWVNIRGYAHILLVPDQSGIARIGELNIVMHAACWMISGIVITGFAVSMCDRRKRFVAISFACYLGMLLVHNWYGMRYLLPVMVVYLLFLVVGAEWIVRLVLSMVPGQKDAARVDFVTRLMGTGALLLLVAANLAFSVLSSQAKRLRSNQYDGVAQRIYEACRFVRDSDGEGAVLATGGGFTGIWTGRKVRTVHSLLDRDGKLVDKTLPDGIGFVLADEGDFVQYRSRYLQPLIDANREQLKEVFRQNDTIVYQVKGGKSRGREKEKNRR